MWAYSGIDECQAIPTAHEEAAHLDGQHPIRVEELGVLEPILIALVEQERRWRLQAPIRDALDRQGTDLHVADDSAEVVPVARRRGRDIITKRVHRDSPRPSRRFNGSGLFVYPLAGG